MRSALRRRLAKMEASRRRLDPNCFSHLSDEELLAASEILEDSLNSGWTEDHAERLRREAPAAYRAMCEEQEW